MQPTSTMRASVPAKLGLFVLGLGCLAFGVSLDRYPGLYVDNGFFAYPALKALLGGTYAYPITSAAPFGDQIWALHGPLFPRLLYGMFKLFGFSETVSLIPDFAGGWLAVLLLLAFLWKKHFRYAGLILAILWCGDRSILEIEYARMEGAALLVLVGCFLALQAAWQAATPARLTLLAGFLAGIATLLNPICALFVAAALLFVLYASGWKATAWFVLGGALNAPILVWAWTFRVEDSFTQLLWHARLMGKDAHTHTFDGLITMLHSGRYWFLALIAVAIACAGVSALVLIRERRRPDSFWMPFLLASAFGLAGLGAISRPNVFPYLIVLFALWPMFCLALLAERYGRSIPFRFVSAALLLVWIPSAAFNLLRLRESILYHSALSERFIRAEINRDIPQDAKIIASPEFYALPLETGHRHFDLTIWRPEHQDVCHDCYLIVPAAEVQAGNYIRQDNLDHRGILYTGPAFPGAGPLSNPVAILTPERAGALAPR